MRLLRADTSELLLENIDEEEAEYAILSHRWLKDEEEITYQDLQRSTERAVLEQKRGWFKLEQCRKQAVEDGLRYVWLDTCCIDKSSSQELTESINSMYRWYERSAVCYAYLHDMRDTPSGVEADQVNEAVTQTEGEVQTSYTPQQGSIRSISERSNLVQHDQNTTAATDRDIGRMEIELEALPEASIGPDSSTTNANAEDDLEIWNACAWFHRGWTLQEMLAPTKLHFYDPSWLFLGDLHQLSAKLSKITHVHREALTKEKSVFDHSIAQRMSWAANRKTTKVEDRAYSLLGLLGVNMGIIYGEGSGAFRRLQYELLRTSSDHSIFVFKRRAGTFEERKSTELLASSPDAFAASGNVVVLPAEFSSYQVLGNLVSFTTILLNTNYDVYEQLRTKGDKARFADRTYFRTPLPCCLETDPAKLIALWFEIMPGSGLEGLSVDSFSIFNVSDVNWRRCLKQTIGVAIERPWRERADHRILMFRGGVSTPMRLIQSTGFSIRGEHEGSHLHLTYAGEDRPECTATVSIEYRNSRPAILQISKSLMAFEGHALYLAYPLRSDHRCVILKWTGRRFIYARMHLNYCKKLLPVHSRHHLIEVGPANIVDVIGFFGSVLTSWLAKLIPTTRRALKYILLATFTSAIISFMPFEIIQTAGHLSYAKTAAISFGGGMGGVCFLGLIVAIADARRRSEEEQAFL